VSIINPDAAYRTGIEVMRHLCLTVVETQIKDLAANYPGAWVAEFATNTCRAVAHAIEALSAPPPQDADA